MTKQQGKKIGGEKAERNVPCVPSPQDHCSNVGTSLLDGAYGERDKLKLWEEEGQKLLNLPDEFLTKKWGLARSNTMGSWLKGDHFKPTVFKLICSETLPRRC